MIRLGIVGSDNSHAERFAELANLEREGQPHVDGVHVTAICGADPARTEEVATNGKIDKIVPGPEAMIGQIDAAAVVYRHGSLHRQNVIPLLEAGIPVFVDKPLACSVADAEAMLEVADRKNVAITSFSTIRVTKSLVDFLATLKDPAPAGGTVIGPCDPDSEYGGHFFYGIHEAELMLASFGHDAQTVTARRLGKTIDAIVSYGDKLVNLRMHDGAGYEFIVAAFTADGMKQHTVDISTCYYDGFQVLLEMFQTGKRPLSNEQMLAPIRLLEAVGRAIETGRDERV